MSDTIQPAPPLPVGAIGPFIGPAQSRTNFWSALEPTFWLAALVTCTSRSKDAMTGKTRKDRGKAGGNARGQVAGGRGAVQQACACCRVGWSPCILACSISICAAPLHFWLSACTPAHSLHCCLPTCAPIPSHHAFCKPTHPTARNAAIILVMRAVALVLVYVIGSLVIPIVWYFMRWDGI